LELVLVQVLGFPGQFQKEENNCYAGPHTCAPGTWTFGLP
jgi:hypothetical protein